MIFGIIGPRDFNGSVYLNADYVGKVLAQYMKRYGITKIISGGGKGIETLVEQWCKANKIDFQMVMPNIKMHGREEAFIYRNNRILKEADLLLLFWDGYNMNAIRPISAAMESCKPVYLIPMV